MDSHAGVPSSAGIILEKIILSILLAFQMSVHGKFAIRLRGRQGNENLQKFRGCHIPNFNPHHNESQTRTTMPAYSNLTDSPRNALMLPWIVWGVCLALVILQLVMALIFIAPLRTLDTAEPIALRTAFYIATIISFPLINLVRHVMLKLNQTMPGPPRHATRRYWMTVCVSMIWAESFAEYGVILYLLGDAANSLYILCGLAILGLALYRPQQREYLAIVSALDEQQDKETCG